ncbi:hypothetical protein [Burkholderia pyrrocinia]|uniref:hypothetical protein n=1 Tax=Burkholderia pyrrocinia TaxID=60550 RepID=UPI002AB31829|nr:hypothetical protein [Burkholderia pyrrocinia]
MDSEDDLISRREVVANDGQLEQLLSIFRMRLRAILCAEFDEEESWIYIIAYDCGVAEGLYGSDSAICVGMKRGLADAVRVCSVGLSLNCIGEVEVVGRKHGALARSMMGERALLPDYEAKGPLSK